MTRNGIAPTAGGLLGPLLVACSILLAWIWVGTSWIATPWSIAGPSMEPTLRPGDRVLVDLWSYRHRRPR